jgi:hypothetical protein
MLKIGGFFELETVKGQEFHTTPYRFNLARHALAAVLLKRGIRTLHVPEYLCDSLLDAAYSVGVQPEFYGLQDIFTPNFPDEIGNDEAVLLINYYGLVDVESLSGRISGRVIVDNSQSFFSSPLSGVDTFYSPRKYFGVPDGSYLYTDMNLLEWYSRLPATRAYGLMQHLIDRMDGYQAEAYLAFKENKRHLRTLPMARMSETSKCILSGIDYAECKRIRLQNFNCLSTALANYNEMSLHPPGVPMYYPLLVNRGAGLRERLIELGIFIPAYWPCVESYARPGSAARRLFADLVCLPIDHRYSENHMNIIIDEVVKYLGV